jgi:hypothetical protein
VELQNPKSLLFSKGYGVYINTVASLRFNQIKVQIVLWLDFLILIFANVFFKINLKTEKVGF